MKRFITKNFIFLANVTVLIFFLILPYILFKGKFYISGDDTRMFYIYPFEYFKQFTFSSWHHISTVGADTPTQFIAPFLLIWSVLALVIHSKVILGYFGFSLPFMLGFVFFQIFIKELLEDRESSLEAFISSLFFICSPILLTNQFFIFLSTVWLIPLIPLISYLFLRYMKTGSYSNVAIAVIACVLFSLSLFSIPWIMGYILPLFLAIALIFLIVKIKKKILYIKRSIIFFTSLGLSQLFWLISFVMTYFGKTDINYGSKILSKGVADTFSPTVLATAHGNIIYPLLNLFHRQIAFDFGWDLRHVFTNFYDKTFFLNTIFILVIFSGIFLYKKKLASKEKNTFFVFLVSFLLALYFFTVNIGPLKDLFLLFGRIPGFVMFRNFYDKFALGYIIFYAVIMGFSLRMIKKFNIRAFNFVCVVLVLLILFNFSQVGNIVNAPLWQTENIGRNITIPQEYLDFMNKVGQNVSSSNTIFTVPFGTALYSVIKDTDSDSVYTGTSPVKLFSGVNDLSGFLSFFFSNANGIIENMLINRDYKGIADMIKTYNVNYLFVTKNIPKNVLNSWVFDRRLTSAQDKNFFKYLAEDKPMIVSSEGNYQLYRLKDMNTMLAAYGLSFEKINDTKYRLYFRGVKNPEQLIYFDSFQPGWNLYPVKNPNLDWCVKPQLINGTNVCKDGDKFIEGEELNYMFKEPVFDLSHKAYTKYFVNTWTLDPGFVKNNLGSDYYKVNRDGTMDLEFVLYFSPQNYFYVGTILSLIVLLGNISYLVFYFIKINKNEKIKK